MENQTLQGKILSKKTFIIILCAIICIAIAAFAILFPRYMSGDIRLMQDIVKQLNPDLIASNYEKLLDEQGFVDASKGSFESLPYDYEAVEPCVSIARSLEGRVVALRIYSSTREIFESNNEFSYEGRFNRMWLTAPMSAWFNYTSSFVLESNYISIGISALDDGNPSAKVEDDLKMIMETVSSKAGTGK